MQRGILRSAFAGGALAARMCQNLVAGYTGRADAMAWLVSGALAFMATPLVAQAQPQAAAVEFNIAAQPLDAALRLFSDQSKQQVLFEEEAVAGKRVRALQGRYAPREALERLLLGAGIQINSTRAGVFTLKLAPVQPVLGEVTLAPVIVTAQAEREGSTEGSGSYTSVGMNTVTKLPLSVRETPQSVTVVTRQQMDDQNLVSVEDVIRQTTGAAKSQRNFGAHVYTMRGYVIPDTNYLIDGIPGGAYNPTGWVPIDTATFDRVEVLRGAGALEVGAGDPSGVVNMVRKRPRAEKHVDFAQSIGSWSHYRTEVDGGGALNEAGTVRGRVVAAYTDRRYFYDLAHSKEPLLYGVVEADLAASTRATVGFRHQEQDTRGYTIFQLPMYSDATSLNLPRSTSLGQYWNRHQAETDEVFAELEHEMAGGWRARLAVNHSQTGIVQKLSTARGAVDPATGVGTAITGNYFVDRDIGASGVDASLAGSFNAWGGTHKAVLGANWTEQKATGRTTMATMNIPVDIFNFNHALIPEPETPAYASQLQDKASLLGLYGNTRLAVTPGLYLHLGGRLNWYKYHTDNLITGQVTSDYQQDAQFTPYAGLVYDLGPQWSVYASYASTFVPQSQYAVFNGGALKPAEGDNHEAGVKGALLDGQLNVAFALFHTKKRHVAVLDTENLGGCPGISTSDCYRNASLLRSKGFDAEVAGRIAPGWEVAAGYTYLTTRDDAGAPLTSDAPHNLLRVSSSYTLPGAWSAWTIGASLNAQSSSYVTVVRNPGRAILDLRASYRIDRHWSASLNVGNVFDKTYWEYVGGTRNGSGYGTPRSAMLTLRGSFD